MLLTVPGEINKHNRYMLTGNDYVSLPWIGTDGSIKEAGVVHYGNNCLVRFSSSSAEGLISPIVSIDGKVKEFQWHWHLLEHWIPMGRLMYGDVVVTITVLTPVDEKGFCCRLSAANRGPENHRVVLGFNVAAGEVQKHIFSSMPLPHSRHFFHQWTQTLVLDGGPGGLRWPWVEN